MPNGHLLYVASANAWERQQKLSLFRIDIYYYYMQVFISIAN